jgi:hypothetical protein
LTFNATEVNDSPILANAIPDQLATKGSVFSLSVAGAFSDVDKGDLLTLRATLPDGNALPSWLKFNPRTGVFTGTPMDADSNKTLSVMVKATDRASSWVSDTFDLVIAGGNMPPVAKAITLPAQLTEYSDFTYLIPRRTFTDIDSGDQLTYSASGLPNGLSINSSTVTITGRVNFSGADIPPSVITLTDTDKAGLSA